MIALFFWHFCFQFLSQICCGKKSNSKIDPGKIIKISLFGSKVPQAFNLLSWSILLFKLFSNINTGTESLLLENKTRRCFFYKLNFYSFQDHWILCTFQGFPSHKLDLRIFWPPSNSLLHVVSRMNVSDLKALVIPVQLLQSKAIKFDIIVL